MHCFKIVSYFNFLAKKQSRQIVWGRGVVLVPTILGRKVNPILIGGPGGQIMLTKIFDIPAPLKSKVRMQSRADMNKFSNNFYPCRCTKYVCKLSSKYLLQIGFKMFLKLYLDF